MDDKIEELQRIGIGSFNIIEAKNIKIYYKGKRHIVDIKIAIIHVGELQIENY